MVKLFLGVGSAYKTRVTYLGLYIYIYTHVMRYIMFNCIVDIKKRFPLDN